MARYYISSKSIQTIILAKTEEAAKLLFRIGHPGIEIDFCSKMATI